MFQLYHIIYICIHYTVKKLRCHFVWQIWCDVHTDGGGFTLVGMKNSPVSWTVPSNAIPVHPQGPPHWSSNLGDLKVLDFRVQVSKSGEYD